MTKTEEYKQLYLGTNKYNCETCFHLTNCKTWEIGKCCGYWFDPESEIEGIAYQTEKKEAEMPLFAR